MSTCLNEDICSLPVQIENHKGHLNRVANITGATDFSLPKSYGLQYLANREKKKQIAQQKEAVIAKTNELFARKLKRIAAEERKQPATLHIKSANAKVRMDELAFLEKNNRYMASNLEKTGSMLPSKETLKARNEYNMKHKKLLSRKFFGSLRNPNCNGEKVKPIMQENNDDKPQWVGIGSQYNTDDAFNLNANDNDSEDLNEDRNVKLRNKSRRRRPETPKAKPTNNHLKPKIEKLSFKIVNMPECS